MPVVFSLPEDGKSTSKYNGACTYLILSPNGKPYVGQAKKFHRRMTNHKSESKLAWIHHAKWLLDKSKKKVAAICFAINKYGWENMEIIILEKYFVWDQFLLDKREQYFIRFYDSFKNGYNSNEGGNRCKPHKWSEEQKAQLSKPVTSREIREEYADGTQLVEFVSYASAADAERKTGVSSGDISQCCNKLRGHRSAGNRFWHFTEQGDLVGEHVVERIGDVPITRPKQALFSESPTGEKDLHESAYAAERTLSDLTGKKFQRTNISACCNNRRQSHKGYKFYFATPEMIAQFKKEASKKRKRDE